VVAKDSAQRLLFQSDFPMPLVGIFEVLGRVDSGQEWYHSISVKASLRVSFPLRKYAPRHIYLIG